MLRFLFPRLTASPAVGEKLFAAVTGEARAKHWYVEGKVPDTLDGRFAMVATIAALIMVRLDESGDSAASVALTERFVEVLESEHRELGIGDPKLGRTMLELVGSLERRLGLWREAASGGEWTDAVRTSVYRNVEVGPAAFEHTVAALKDFWNKLERIPMPDLFDGRLS